MDASSANNTLDGINAQYLSQFTDFPGNASIPTLYWNTHDLDSGIVLNGSGNILRNSTIAWSAGNAASRSCRKPETSYRNNLIVNTGYTGATASGINLNQRGVTKFRTTRSIQAGGHPLLPFCPIPSQTMTM